MKTFEAENNQQDDNSRPDEIDEMSSAARRLGLKPVRAWVPDATQKDKTSAAERTKRARIKAEGLGVKQLSVALPTDLHQPVKNMAARIKAGESIASAIVELLPDAVPATSMPPLQRVSLSGMASWRRWLLRWLLPAKFLES